MTEFINNILDQIQNYSTSISKKATFLDKPWALMDNEMEIQKLIFQKGNQLILSKNGKVQMGTWEYLVGAKSMLIDRGNDKLLLNEVFINDDVMILKVDGTKNDFFVLANQNTIPDLDVISYLEGLKYSDYKSKELKLKDGKVLTMYSQHYIDNYLGHIVTIDRKPAKNGFYEYKEDYLFLIQDGKVVRPYRQKYYQNPDGNELRFLQKNSYHVETTDFIYLNGERIMDGEVNYNEKYLLIIKNGKVIKLKRKKSILQSITDLFRKDK